MISTSPRHSTVKKSSRYIIAFTTVGIILLTSLLSGRADAHQSPDLALQGFSGILNTPTGHVQNEGTFSALYSDQRDHFRGETPPWQDNYLFSVGMFNFAEIGGRLTEVYSAPKLHGSGMISRNRYARDLSANAKLSSAPFTAQLPFAPTVALGIQDVGGGASFFRTPYLAASVDPLSWLRLSGGYGHGPDRMKGKFGGIEVKAHDWVTLLGEYDTNDTNAGLRLIAPPLPWLQASLTATAKLALNRSSNMDIAFGLTIPLDMKKPAAHPITTGGADRTASPAPIEPPAAAIEKATTPDATVASRLNSIRKRLITAGFANVRVGVLNSSGLVVEYENVRYNHNELDAIGIVAGIASSDNITGVDTLTLVIKRKGLRMLQVSAPLRAMNVWLTDTEKTPPPSLTVSLDTSAVEAARFIDGDSNPDWLKPSLILYPGLKTFVGTEVGVYDYLLSVKPDLQVTAWKGAVLNARWDLPVSWSDNFDDYQPFAYARNKPMMDRLMLFQGISLAPGLMANLGGGMILHNINGTLNEVVWSPGSGMHRIRAAQAYARNSDTHEDTRVLLGSYRVYVAPLDLFLEGTVGRFWGQDTGGLVTLKRFFGDTAVDLYYKNTETLEKKRWQAAGMQISFPLTPRRDMKRAPIQVRGNEEWGYGQETVLAIGDQKTNDTISAALGINPLPSPSIYRSYLNRDRLNDDYIQLHKPRLKEAWKTFRDSLDSGWPAY